MHVTGDAYQKFYLLCQYYAQCFLMPIMLQITQHNQLKPTQVRGEPKDA